MRDLTALFIITSNVYYKKNHNATFNLTKKTWPLCITFLKSHGNIYSLSKRKLFLLQNAEHSVIITGLRTVIFFWKLLKNLLTFCVSTDVSLHVRMHLQGFTSIMCLKMSLLKLMKRWSAQMKMGVLKSFQLCVTFLLLAYIINIPLHNIKTYSSFWECIFPNCGLYVLIVCIC